MAKIAKRKRMGRPPLPPGKRKRESMGFRPTPELRRKLEKAAQASGLSLTQVVERRLDQSFLRDELLGGQFGEKSTYRLMVMLGSTINLVQEMTGKNWRKDRRTYVEVKRAVSAFLDAFGPADQEYPKGFRDVFATSIGRDAVEQTIGYLRESEAELRSPSKPKG